MATGELWYGSSFSRLRDEAFDWLDERAGSSPESAWFLEANDYQHDAIADAWRENYDGLRLRVSGLARFALTIHEQLFGPYPDIETLERQSVSALAEHYFPQLVAYAGALMQNDSDAEQVVIALVFTDTGTVKQRVLTRHDVEELLEWATNVLSESR